MPINKTTEQFKQEVYSKVGNEYTVLGEYVNCKTKILIRHNCETCNNYEYEVSPNNFLTGKRCPRCAKRERKNTTIFKQEVYSKVGNEYTVLGEYVNTDSKIKMRHNCKTCNNHEYTVRPTDFLRGKRCPKCCGNIRKTTDEFKAEVKKLENTEYTVLGEYVNWETKIKIRHNLCNHEYMVRPNDFLSGYRCPKCRLSKGNKYIYDYLTKKNIEFIDEKSFDTCKYKDLLKFDFYIPHLNLLLEFDGIQHFDESQMFGINDNGEKFKNQIKRDQIKNNWVQNNTEIGKIKLIRIGYKNYDKLEEILNEILLTNDFDPNNYTDIYTYYPNTEIIFESGIYK